MAGRSSRIDPLRRAVGDGPGGIDTAVHSWTS
jgi:hypothetical protein